MFGYIFPTEWYKEMLRGETISPTVDELLHKYGKIIILTYTYTD